MISIIRVNALSEEPDAGNLLVRVCGGSSLQHLVLQRVATRNVFGQFFQHRVRAKVAVALRRDGEFSRARSHSARLMANARATFNRNYEL